MLLPARERKMTVVDEKAKKHFFARQLGLYSFDGADEYRIDDCLNQHLTTPLLSMTETNNDVTNRNVQIRCSSHSPIRLSPSDRRSDHTHADDHATALSNTVRAHPYESSEQSNQVIPANLSNTQLTMVLEFGSILPEKTMEVKL